MGYATEAVTDMPGLPAQPKVPVWVTDDRWGAWHVWLPQDVMTREGRALTACGCEWYWSATAATSYQILAEAGCQTCHQALLLGLPAKRGRGRRSRLPQGPLPPRTPGRPGRPPKPIIEPLPLPGTDLPYREEVARRRAEMRAAVSTPETPGSGANADTKSADDEELDFTFEVGRRLPAWDCIQCGTVLAAGDRYCSTWCSREHIEGERAARRERSGLVMARRQFIDQLYGRPRRDTIRSWTPPVSQIRRRRWSP